MRKADTHPAVQDTLHQVAPIGLIFCLPVSLGVDGRGQNRLGIALRLLDEAGDQCIRAMVRKEARQVIDQYLRLRVHRTVFTHRGEERVLSLLRRGGCPVRVPQQRCRLAWDGADAHTRDWARRAGGPRRGPFQRSSAR